MTAGESNCYPGKADFEPGPICDLQSLGKNGPEAAALRVHRTRGGDALECPPQRTGGEVNIEIMRAFVRLRQILASHEELARKLDALEKKYDSQFRVIFDAIRQLMAPPTPEQKKRRIGFRSPGEPD